MYSFSLLFLLMFVPVTQTMAANQLHYTPSHLIVAEGPGLQLFASYDGGGQWQQVEPLPEGIRYGVFTGPPTGVWLATHNGLFWSPEHLWSWQRVWADPVAWITWSPNGEHCLFKVWGGGVLRAGPGGLLPGADRDLHRRLTLPLARPVQTATITDDGTIYIGLFDVGLFMSDDGGDTWSSADTGLPTRQVLELRQSPQGQLYAGTFGAGLWRWEPTDLAWQLVDETLAGTIITAMAFDGQGAMMVGTQEQGLYVSQPSGRDWRRDESVSAAAVLGITAVPDGSWWLYQPEVGLFVHDPNQLSWNPRPFRFTNRVQQVAVAPDDRWYINIAGAGLAVSFNEGQSWRLLNVPVPWQEDSKFAVAQDGILFFASGSELWRSVDGGDSWHREEGPWGDVPVAFLQQGPQGDVYLAMNERGGLYYLDEQAHWQLVAAKGSVPHSYWVHHVHFFPERTVAYGAYDILVEGPEGWTHTHFGQSGRRVFQTTAGELATERMLSSFVYNPADERWLPVDPIAASRRFTTVHSFDDGEHVGVGGPAGFAWWWDTDELHWSKVFEAMVVLDLFVMDEQRLLAGTTQGLWYSLDRGRSWSQIPLLFQ